MSVDRMRAIAATSTGDAAWPAADGEPVFQEPWEGRAFALALELVDRLDVPWESFRRRLVAAIDADPSRPYYASWVDALEWFAGEEAGLDARDLVEQRNHAAGYRYAEEGVGDVEVFPVPADEATLLDLLTVLFEMWWDQVSFGPIIQGAVYELRLRRRPRVTVLDGYVTIDGGDGHVHVCIGPHTGRPGRGVTAEVARRRRCRHAELMRVWVDGAPSSWALRLFNGDDHQQLTVLLPNPFLDNEDRPVAPPDWNRLACWDDLRGRFLGLAPDQADRLGTRFRHG